MNIRNNKATCCILWLGFNITLNLDASPPVSLCHPRRAGFLASVQATRKYDGYIWPRISPKSCHKSPITANQIGKWPPEGSECPCNTLGASQLHACRNHLYQLCQPHGQPGLSVSSSDAEFTHTVKLMVNIPCLWGTYPEASQLRRWNQAQ